MADEENGEALEGVEGGDDVVALPRESTNNLLSLLTAPLIELIAPTTLSFPPTPVDPSSHPPTTSALSAIHIRALECLNNLFLSVDEGDDLSHGDAFTDADRQGARDVWSAVWKALVQVGEIVVDGKISAIRSFQKKKEFWEGAMGVLWGVAKIGRRHLVS